VFISKSEKKNFKRRIESLEADRWAGRQMTSSEASELTKKIRLLFEYLNVQESYTPAESKLTKRPKEKK